NVLPTAFHGTRAIGRTDPRGSGPGVDERSRTNARRRSGRSEVPRARTVHQLHVGQCYPAPAGHEPDSRPGSRRLRFAGGSADRIRRGAIGGRGRATTIWRLEPSALESIMAPRHFLSMFDISLEELQEIFRLAEQLKREWQSGQRQGLFSGRVLALLFEKPSLRTRVSFEVAMTHLGGSSLFLGKDVGWGERESAADFSQVLGQY